MNRIMITIPDDIKLEVEDLKRNTFYDEPYAEIYRQAIRAGLDAMGGEKLKSVEKKETSVECVGKSSLPRKP